MLRNKRDRPARLLQKNQRVEHAPRAAVTVALRHQRAHQHAALVQVAHGQRELRGEILARRAHRLPLQRGGLAREKLFPVHHLIAFHAALQIHSRRAALAMKHRALRLVENFFARRAHAETIVRVFVITGAEFCVEAAKLAEQFARRGEQRAGAVIHLAHKIAERRVEIRRGPAKIQRRAVAENTAARLLQRAIGQNQFAADHPCRRKIFERVEQRREPAGQQHQVVVQKK